MRSPEMLSELVPYCPRSLTLQALQRGGCGAMSMIWLVAVVGLGACTKTKTTAESSQSAAVKSDPSETAAADKATAKAAPAEPATTADQAPAGADTAGAGATAKATDGTPAGGKVVKLVTSKGEITIELAPDKAPKSVANFLRYVRDGHFSGTIFHRVIKDFMIQGGGFDTSYQKKPTRGQVQNEADNGLKNDKGTVAMARTPDPHSASAQFFINLKDNDFLNFRSKTPRGWGYTVFGRVTAGMDVVMAISAVATGPGGPFSRDAPQEPIVIKSAAVLK